MKKFTRLMVLLVCCMATTNVWAMRYAKAIVQSEPSNGGYVYVSSSNSAPGTYDKTNDNSTQYNGRVSSVTFTFYRFYSAKPNYVFKGWSESSSANSGTTSSSVGIEGDRFSYSGATKTYYAIFARMTADKSSVNFGNTNTGKSSTQTITISHAHAGQITASLSGDNAADFALSSTTPVGNSVSEGTATLTITFTPSCIGTRTATLTLKSNNGLSNVTISLAGVGVLNEQTLTWSDVEETVYVGTTQTFGVTSNSGLAVTYTSDNDEVLSISGNNLVALKGGTATITATQTGDDCTWAAATSTKTFTVKKFTPAFLLQFDPALTETSVNVFSNVTVALVNTTETVSVECDETQLEYSIIGSVLTVKALKAGDASFIVSQPETGTTEAASTTFTLHVNKIAQTISWETPDTILTTETVVFNATAQGAIVYSVNSEDIATLGEDNALTILKSGVLELTATAAATENYNEATLTKTITVERATPIVTEWPSLGEIIYGATLADVVLAGGLADVEGTFSIAEDDLTRIPEGGEQQISVQFVPANTDWYNTLTNTLTLVVNPADQEILWEPADSILTTTTLALDATAKTALSYTTEDSDIATINEDNTVTILKAGELHITVNAAATANYNAATLSRTITIQIATPEITILPTFAQLTYGQKLSEAVLAGGEATAEGAFVLNEEDAEAVLNAGEHKLKVQFVPTNGDWYTAVDTVVMLTVAKAEQTIVWETPTEISVTDQLVLSATAEGEVTYTIESADIARFNDDQTALTFVKYGTLRLTVAAAETENYNAATLPVELAVASVTPEIYTAPALAPVEVGKTLADVSIQQGTASVAGWFGWASDIDLDAVLGETGTFTYTLVFTPSNTDWYNTIDGIEVTLQVVDGTVTGIDNQTVDTKAVKVLRDGQLYILRSGKTYDPTGRKVR